MLPDSHPARSPADAASPEKSPVARTALPYDQLHPSGKARRRAGRRMEALA